MSGCSCIDVTEDTVELESLLRHVAPIVPEIPYEMQLDLVRQAYTEFARKTKLCVVVQTLRIQRDVKEYPLEVPDGYHVFALLHADDGKHVYGHFPTVDTWYYFWGDRFRMLENKYLEFKQAPSKEYDRRIALHVLPTECAVTIPSEIAVPYGRGIAMGAVADALDMPNKAWYNPRAAANKRRDFYREVQNGLALHLTNRGAHSITAKPVRVL